MSHQRLHLISMLCLWIVFGVQAKNLPEYQSLILWQQIAEDSVDRLNKLSEGSNYLSIETIDEFINTYQKALNLKSIGDFAAAEHALNQLIQKLIKSNLKNLVAHFYMEKVDLLIMRSAMDEAENLLKFIKGNYNENVVATNFIRYLSQFAFIKLRQGALEDSLTFVQQMDHLVEAETTGKYRVSNTAFLAQMYFRLRQFQRAETYVNRSLAALDSDFESEQIVDLLALKLQILWSQLGSQQRDKLMLSILEKATALADKNQLLFAFAYFSYIKANLRLEQGKYALAIPAALKSVDIYRQLSKLEHLTSARLLLLETLILDRQLDSAVQVADTISLQLEASEQVEYKIHLLALKSRLLAAQNNTRDAYELRLESYFLLVSELKNNLNARLAKIKTLINDNSRAYLLKTSVLRNSVNRIAISTEKTKKNALHELIAIVLATLFISIVLFWRWLVLRKQLSFEKHYDSLTHVTNKENALLALEKTLLVVKKRALISSVLMIKIDHIREINANFGYEIGDKVLINVARVLKFGTPSQFIIGRLSDNIFLIIGPDCDREACFTHAERLRQEVIAFPWHSFQATLDVTVSVVCRNIDKEDNGPRLLDALLVCLRRENKPSNKSELLSHEQTIPA